MFSRKIPRNQEWLRLINLKGGLNFNSLSRFPRPTLNSLSAESQEPACKSVSSAGGFLTVMAFSKAKVSNPDYPWGKCMHNGNTCKTLEHPHRAFLLQFPLRSSFSSLNHVSFLLSVSHPATNSREFFLSDVFAS